MGLRTIASLSLASAALTACGSDGTAPRPPEPQFKIAVVSGNNQSGTATSMLPAPLVVQVTANELPVIQALVNWIVVSGGGSVSESSKRTDERGQASVTWALGTTVGNQSVSASLGGSEPPAVFSATATAPPIYTRLLAIHYDGTAWKTSLQHSTQGVVGEWFDAIWGNSGSEVVAGGGGCQLFLFRYDGTAWTGPSTCTGMLYEVASISGNSGADVFALEQEVIGPYVANTILHFDGQTWKTQFNERSLTFGLLRGVWSRSAGDATAVGDGGMILHYDGQSWTSQASGTTADLSAIWGDRASPAMFAPTNAGTILRFDGTTWQSQATGTSQPLYAIWGASPTDIFAVGASGTIVHYDGVTWTAEPSGTSKALRSVWGNSGKSVFAVGDAGTVLHYDGTTWSAMPSNTPMDLRGVWGTSANDVFAVGKSIASVN